MDVDDPDFSIPRLRGLDPDLLLGVLEDDVIESPPEVPGWRITGVAGSGGSGIVWRAMRVSDGVEAAIKIAAPGDPETVERIEHEARFLSELLHPNIVALLDSGPINSGPEEGGLYLAMEFIDGPALSHEIPEPGLVPDQAYQWFRQIAEAVAHAHDRGILHRDLKPGNVLVAPDGTLKVADFGLARPVHRRVHQLSLTRAGLIAGTAEYLPPEAYRRDHQPSAAGDIFALGVMLHEMLTGTPPRGAWRPASSRNGVDVRMDAVIAKAMDTDPARRWPDVEAMIFAIGDILTSPPRYQGTPLVTPPVRVADAAWSMIGLITLIALTSTLARLDKSRLSLPFDLVGGHGNLTGGFQALFFLLLASVPLSIWQVVRLLRFRHVPLSEALPSPFGLHLGNRRLAAALVALAQFTLFWLPALLLALLFLQSGLRWIHPDDPPWVHGLAVTSMDDRLIISPWDLKDGKDGFWLWESVGPPSHTFAKTVDRISFVPFFGPFLVAACGVLLASALACTVLAACFRWWGWKRKARSMALGAGMFAFASFFAGAWSRELAKARADAIPRPDDFVISSHMTTRAREHAEWLLGISPSRHPLRNSDGTRLYKEQVSFRDHGRISSRRVGELLAASRTRADEVLVEAAHYEQSWNPADHSFNLRVRAVETFDGREPGGDCGADDLLLELSGTASLDGTTRISGERLSRVPMYRTESRAATRAELDAWFASFSAGLRDAVADPPEANAILTKFFLPVPGVLPDRSDPTWLRWLPDMAGDFPALLREELSGNPDATAVIEGYRCGGITRIRIQFSSGGAAPDRRLHMDLVHVSGSWRCVRLAF